MKIGEITKELVVIILTSFMLVGFMILTMFFIPSGKIREHIPAFTCMVISFTIIMYAIYTAKANIKTGFLFSVTPGKEKCSIGYTGLPHLNFSYIPDNERMNMPSCNNINAYNQAKVLKTPKDEEAQEDELIRQNAFLY